MPGDPSHSDAIGAVSNVSIHARHQCRAIQPCPGPVHRRRFVSIHARHQCRAIPDLSVSTCRQENVSIHARHQCRAIPGGQLAVRGQRRFNPRPASMPGDPSHHARPRAACSGFNPRPASMPGDPAYRQHVPASQRRFNPRPASMPGDPYRSQIRSGTSVVSIHARHQCRAIQSGQA